MYFYIYIYDHSADYRMCKGPQCCEPVLTCLDVREFELTATLSELTRGMTTNERF